MRRQKSVSKNQPVMVRIPDHHVAEIDLIAQEQGEDRSSIVRTAVREMLEARRRQQLAGSVTAAAR